MLALPDGAYEA